MLVFRWLTISSESSWYRENVVHSLNSYLETEKNHLFVGYAEEVRKVGNYCYVVYGIKPPQKAERCRTGALSSVLHVSTSYPSWYISGSWYKNTLMIWCTFSPFSLVLMVEGGSEHTESSQMIFQNRFKVFFPS